MNVAGFRSHVRSVSNRLFKNFDTHAEWSKAKGQLRCNKWTNFASRLIEIRFTQCIKRWRKTIFFHPLVILFGYKYVKPVFMKMNILYSHIWIQKTITMKKTTINIDEKNIDWSRLCYKGQWRCVFEGKYKITNDKKTSK